MDEGNSEHDQLFLKLKILFAGYNDNQGFDDSVVEFFINKILYKSYRFVIDLRKMRQKYLEMKQNEIKNKKLQILLDKIGDSLGNGRNMSKIQVKALLSQIKVISPYNNKIKDQQHGVFINLDNLIDIGNGIRKIHLKKASQLLPNVFANLTKKTNTKALLEKDLKETQQNYKNIEIQVQKKVYAVQRAIEFHDKFFVKFQKEFNNL